METAAEATPPGFSWHGFANKLTTPIVNLFGAHPWFCLAVIGYLVIGRPMTIAYIVSRWPDYTKRPAAANGLLGSLKAMSHLYIWALTPVLKRFGLTPPPEEDTTGPLTVITVTPPAVVAITPPAPPRPSE